MTPRTRIRRRRSSSRHSKTSTASVEGLATLVTTFLLAVVLIIGPLILGAARLWIELPLLGVVALLLAIQGLRLTAKPAADAPRRIDAIDLSVALFVLYAIVRWLTSPTEYFSRIEVMDIVAYAGIFLTCRYGMPNRRYCMALLYALVVLGVVETAVGYYLINHMDWFPFGAMEKLQLYYAPRWVGTYTTPNGYACFLVMAIGAAIALGSFSKLAWPARIILLYLAITMVVGVTYSGSRGGWIAFVASIVALVIMGIRNGTMRWWWPVSAGLVWIAVSGFLLSQSQVAQDRLTGAEEMASVDKFSTDQRVELTRDALRIARDHPLWGTGPATFGFIHPHYQGRTFADKAEWTRDDYLNCLDDYGLAGFGIALFFITAVTLKFFRPLDVDNRWQDRVLVATGFAAWMSLLVHSLLDFNLHIPANALLLFFLTGLAMGRIKGEKEAHWSTLSLAPLGRGLGGGVMILSLIYGIQVARTALSDRAYERAVAKQDVVPYSESIAAAEQALNYDGGNAQAWLFLGDLHRYNASLQKESASRANESQEALDAYERALRSNALDDSIQARMGMALDIAGKYPEALGHYMQAVNAQPYNGQFWYWLGNHYLERGMTDEAKRAYLRAEQCPHGVGRGAESEKQLRALPARDSMPASLLTEPTPPQQTKAPDSAR